MNSIEGILHHSPQWVGVLPIKQINLNDKLQWLSDSEFTRANRFKVDFARDTYILAHAFKRYCLSTFLKCEAKDLVFEVGEKGKPFCTFPGAPFFNLSHTEDCVLFGFSTVSELGVDIELLNRRITLDVAKRVLSSHQQIKLSESSSPEQTFMLYWTQKEAISKALGLGLSINFSQVDCSGEQGYCLAKAKEKSLHVNSKLLHNHHVISLASFEEALFDLYFIESWGQTIVAVQGQI